MIPVTQSGPGKETLNIVTWFYVFKAMNNL